jgi:hypothetical protein
MKGYFNCLTLPDKYNFVKQNGRYLISTNFYGSVVKLYSLQASFVEIYHHPVQKYIMRISIATDEDLLKHLKEIQLPIV